VIVDVVIVAYNSRTTLRACVESLVRAPWVDVTVVDNASPAGPWVHVGGRPCRLGRVPEFTVPDSVKTDPSSGPSERMLADEMRRIANALARGAETNNICARAHARFGPIPAAAHSRRRLAGEQPVLGVSHL
jgi:hypothetical protein